MHSRYGTPGNGYRSSFTGSDMPNPRISPDQGSARDPGHGFYNSKYRSSFNNKGFGYGRGQGQMKSYQPPVPTPWKVVASTSIGGGGGEIFMEAGRLAAEYLVSQGLLPPSALSGRGQNGNDKVFRSQDRKSALSHVGNSSFNARRRPYTDYNMTGNRAGGFFQGDSREYERSSLWSNRGNRVSPDMGGVDGDFSRRYDEHLSGKDASDGLQSSDSVEYAPKTEETGYAEVELEKSQLLDDLGSSSGGKNISHSTDVEFLKTSDDSTNMTEPEKKDIVDNSSIQQCDAETDPSSNSGVDLISLSKFANVPTKTRSSLTYKASSKADSFPSNDKETNPDRGSNTEDLAEDTSLDDVISGKSNKSHDDFEVFEPIEKLEELDSDYGLEQGKWMRSQSFPNIGSIQGIEQELGQSCLPILQRSITVVMERGEKRTIEESNTWEGIKKAKEWLQPLGIEAEETIQRAKLSEAMVTVAVLPKVSVANSQFSSSGGEMCIDYADDGKQIFPSSFKICDLNLLEGSDMNENQNSLIERSVLETKKEVDIDLSISNSDISGENSRQMKEIEVIDLENDSTEKEEKAIDNLEQRAETGFTSLDSFSNNEQNSDVHDHYDGLMITEYLDAFSNIATTQQDINPLQSDIGLPHVEDTLIDDDAIYMSLGEIPLSFLPAWEHSQPREYEKPF